MLYVSGFDSTETREAVLDDVEVYGMLIDACDGDAELIALSLAFMWHDPNYLMLSDIERKAGSVE